MENFINYNRSIFNVRGIHTAPAGLESTALVFVYGIGQCLDFFSLSTDMFFSTCKMTAELGTQTGFTFLFFSGLLVVAGLQETMGFHWCWVNRGLKGS